MTLSLYNYFAASVTILSATGKSWTSPEKTDLPNNNAAIQAIVLSNGKVVICYNPTNGPRDIMRISLSEDGGKTWPHYKVIMIISTVS